MKVYSTLTRKQEEFVPLHQKQVRMYGCGITVYDDAHIGHARQAIVYDIFFRYLKYRGYDVTYVRNFTDVDDKIISRAKEQGMSALELSAKYVERTRNDMLALGLLPATHEPKVSDHIPQIIEFIEGLIAKGSAYAAGGDVLFDVTKKADYGKLSGRSLENILSADESTHKKHPGDFALWKGAKEGEVAWDSPWGKGRPGWHIECSAMARVYLGDELDIHGGGVDLVFPHHENEIAQSESLTGKPFAKYWLHNGLVNIDGKKMSKSLGNFVTVEQALRDYTPDIIKYAVLAAHYSSPMDFADSVFKQAFKRVHYLYKWFVRLEETAGSTQAPDANPLAEELRNGFIEAMDDDFNTPRVIALLSESATKSNQLFDKKGDSGAKAQTAAALLAVVREISGALGFLNSKPQAALSDFRAKALASAGLAEEDIQEKIALRTQAKKDKNFAVADQVRAELLALNIALQDNPQGGTTWDIAS